MLNATVNDDHDYQTNDEEEKKDNVNGCVALSRSLRQLCLELSSLVGLKVAQIQGRIACQICTRHDTSSESKKCCNFTYVYIVTYNRFLNQ